MTGADIIKRFDNMNDYVIGNWMNMWQEQADWAWPTNDNVNRIRIAGQEKPPQRMIDTCIDSNHKFASGFFSNIFPPGQIWAKFKHESPEMMANENVAYYFEKISRIIHSILISTNFASEEFQNLLAMGCFGTTCMSVEEDKKKVVKFKNYTISRVRIAENYQGTVDTVSREFELDARQAIQQFGEDALGEADLDRIITDNELNKNSTYKFVHYVCPRTDFDPDKKDGMNKEWASYYVSRDTQMIVSESGFDYNPYKVARFATGNDEVYGRGPMSMKLATARRANVIYRSVIVAGEQNTNPQWLIPDDGSVKNLSSRAGAHIKYRANHPNGKPERLPPAGDPYIGVELLKMHIEEIDRGFYGHLWTPLEEYRNMTAYEVSERINSDMKQLTAFVSRYINEKVTPMMEMVYYFCQKAGKLPDLPIELLEDPEFEIEYTGRLAMATKNSEITGTVGTMKTLGELSQIIPQLGVWADNIDPDKVTRDMWHAASGSMNALRDPKKVKMIRDERQAEMEAQRDIDNLAAKADAAQKMSGKVDPNSVLANMEQ